MAIHFKIPSRISLDLGRLFICVLALACSGPVAQAMQQSSAPLPVPGPTKKSTKKKPVAPPAASPGQAAPGASPATSTSSSGNSAASAVPSPPEAASGGAPAQPASAAPQVSPASAQQPPVARDAEVVWVNTESGVYHKVGTRYYGKTKKGKYMTEADAIKAGYRPARRE